MGSDNWYSTKSSGCGNTSLSLSFCKSLHIQPFCDTKFEELNIFLAVLLLLSPVVVEERSCVSLFDVAKIKSVVQT
jgi:hypothetical protein